MDEATEEDTEADRRQSNTHAGTHHFRFPRLTRIWHWIMEGEEPVDGMEVREETINKSMVGLVLGKGGATFRLICNHCGVFARIEQTRDNAKVELYGPEREFKLARHLYIACCIGFSGMVVSFRRFFFCLDQHALVSVYICFVSLPLYLSLIYSMPLFWSRPCNLI